MMKAWCPECKRYVTVVDEYGKIAEGDQSTPEHCSECGYQFNRQEV
jgi:transposase-like protein